MGWFEPNWMCWDMHVKPDLVSRLMGCVILWFYRIHFEFLLLAIRIRQIILIILVCIRKYTNNFLFFVFHFSFYLKDLVAYTFGYNSGSRPSITCSQEERQIYRKTRSSITCSITFFSPDLQKCHQLHPSMTHLYDAYLFACYKEKNPQRNWWELGKKKGKNIKIRKEKKS